VSDAEALRALMEADRWIDRVGAQRTRLPEQAELATLEEELRGLVGALEGANAALAPVRTAYEDTQRESERLRRREGEVATALAASTAGARELTALQKELTHLRELLAETEDRELELLLGVEPLDEAVAAIKDRARPAMARRAELQATIAALVASLDEELVSLRTQRTQRADALAPALLAIYDHALTRAGTAGAAQVVDGRCDGCRIALSPLDFDRWRAQGENGFTPCPNCGRLLLS